MNIVNQMKKFFTFLKKQKKLSDNKKDQIENLVKLAKEENEKDIIKIKELTKKKIELLKKRK